MNTEKLINFDYADSIKTKKKSFLSNIGVINAPAQILKDWINDTYIARHDMPLSENTIDLIWSFVVSVFLIGGAVGSFAASFIANRYGR